MFFQRHDALPRRDDIVVESIEAASIPHHIIHRRHYRQHDDDRLWLRGSKSFRCAFKIVPAHPSVEKGGRCGRVDRDHVWQPQTHLRALSELRHPSGSTRGSDGLDRLLQSS